NDCNDCVTVSRPGTSHSIIVQHVLVKSFKHTNGVLRIDAVSHCNTVARQFQCDGPAGRTRSVASYSMDTITRTIRLCLVRALLEALLLRWSFDSWCVRTVVIDVFRKSVVQAALFS